MTFVDYFDDLLFPFYKAKYPELTEQLAIQIVSMRHIEDYLRTAQKIEVMHNLDDLILESGKFIRDLLRQNIQSCGKELPHLDHDPTHTDG